MLESHQFVVLDFNNQPIMILGSEHLANPGADIFDFRMNDVFAPKYQSETKQLVVQLKAFRPTKIALEADERFNTKINTNYQDYPKGSRVYCSQ